MELLVGLAMVDSLLMALGSCRGTPWSTPLAPLLRVRWDRGVCLCVCVCVSECVFLTSAMAILSTQRASQLS